MAANRLRATSLQLKKRLFSGSAEAPSSYSTGVQIMHWAMGGAMAGSVGLVLLAQNTTDKQKKGDLMFYHKSFGTLAALLLGPRIAIRLMSKSPGPLPGSGTVEVILGSITHYVLYGFAIFLPLSGVAMGYFGGNGLPLFFTTIKGAVGEEKKPEVAKWSYKYHKLAGQAFEYLVPAHIGAALLHALRGQSIFPRIIGFLKPK